MKKGGFYTVLLVPALLIVIVLGVTSLSNKIEPYKEQIGSAQFDLLLTYERGEKIMHFIDSAFDMALTESINNVAKKGGFTSKEICGSTDSEYKILNPKIASCAPSSALALTVLQEEFAEVLPKHLLKFQNFPQIDYSYSIVSDNGFLEATGTTSEKLKIVIGDDEIEVGEGLGRIESVTDSSGGGVTTIYHDFDIKKPFDGTPGVTSCFGRRTCPQCATKNHHGIDYGLGSNTDVKAAADGTVIFAGPGETDPETGNLKGYGIRVIIQHQLGSVNFYTLYGHLASVLVEKNDWVAQGDIIAKSDNTGSSTGSHLHFEVRALNNLYNNAINPFCAKPDLYGSCGTSPCDFSNGVVWEEFRENLEEASGMSDATANVIGVTGNAILSDEPDLIVDDYALDETCGYYNGSICLEEEVCGGSQIPSSDSEYCCIGQCKTVKDYKSDISEESTVNIPVQKTNVVIDDISEGISQPKKPSYNDITKNSQILVGIIIGIVLLIILFIVKKKNLISFSLIGVLILIAGLALYDPNSTNNITGLATYNNADFSEYFNYGGIKDQNLVEALSAISTEFRNNGIEITPHLLVTITTTLKQEVGGSGIYGEFKPIQEVGDYGYGPGCGYGIAGTCRSKPYDRFVNGDGLGGIDYKGRGYIQITHRYNYLNDCGEECVSDAPKEDDICKCHGRATCEVTDETICPMAKALRPEYAARIFVSYYRRNNLVAKANNQEFWEVGKRINGGSNYADRFQTHAIQKLQALNENPSKASALLTYLNEVEYVFTPGPVPSGDPSQPTPQAEFITGIPIEIAKGLVKGYYFLNPSASAKEEYDVSVYDEIAKTAEDFIGEMESCMQEHAELLIEKQSECNSIQEELDVCPIDLQSQRNLKLRYDNCQLTPLTLECQILLNGPQPYVDEDRCENLEQDNLICNEELAEFPTAQEHRYECLFTRELLPQGWIIEEPLTYSIINTLKVDFDTGLKTYDFNHELNRYEEKPVIMKFQIITP